jgi:hypothetical protein
MIYTVFKVLTLDSKQLLLVQDKASDKFSLAVYDEHTGNTLMRLTQPVTIEALESAIACIKES